MAQAKYSQREDIQKGSIGTTIGQFDKRVFPIVWSELPLAAEDVPKMEMR